MWRHPRDGRIRTHASMYQGWGAIDKEDVPRTSNIRATL